MTIHLSNCQSCPGICCLSPPQLTNEVEIEKAQKYGVQILATEVEPGKYGVSIVQQNDQCPFLQDGQCSIYDDRFLACKEYKCKLLTPGVHALQLIDAGTFNSENPIDKQFFSKESIEKYKIDIVDLHTMAEKVIVLSAKKYTKLVVHLITNLKENG